jgi:hypothetical protein
MKKQSNLIGTGHSTTVSCSIHENDHRFLFRFKVIDEYGDHTRMVESFNSYFQKNYYASPTFFPGTLGQALDEAFQTRSIKDVRFAPYFS